MTLLIRTAPCQRRRAARSTARSPYGESVPGCMIARRADKARRVSSSYGRTLKRLRSGRLGPLPRSAGALGDHHHGRLAAAGRSASRPGSRPASRCRADARPRAARPSPGAGWRRTAAPVGSLALDAVALEDAEEAALDALEALAQLGDDLRLVRRRRRAGWRGRGAGSRPPRPRRWRISAPRIAACRPRRAWRGRGRSPSRPRRAASGRACRRARPPARRCGRQQSCSAAGEASAVPASAPVGSDGVLMAR